MQQAAKKSAAQATPHPATTKTAKVAKILSDPPTKDARIKRMERMNDEDLIRLGLRCLDDQQKAKDEYAIIMEILECRFPCKKTEEEIVTASGVAKRSVTNTYLVDEKQIDGLQKELGPEFYLYVSTKPVYEVPTDRIAALRTTLGRKAPEYIVEKVEYVATPLLRNALKKGDDALVDRVEGYISVATKVKVSVKGIDQ